MAESDTLVNALVGAVVSVVLAVLPFSPVLGGAVAGYLQRGDTNGGARVGGISGALAAIPLFLLAALVVAVASFVTIAPAGVPRSGLIAAAIFAVAVLVVALYTVGLGALGGVLGVMLADHRDETRVERVDEPDAGSTDDRH